MDKLKSCRTCKKDLVWSEFSRSAHGQDGLAGECKACRRDYLRTRRVARAAVHKEAERATGTVGMTRRDLVREVQRLQAALALATTRDTAIKVVLDRELALIRKEVSDV